MEKKRKIKILTTVFLIVAVLGLTVAFAAVAQQLTINGKATASKSTFDVYFANLTSSVTRAEFTGKPPALPVAEKTTSFSYDVKMTGGIDENKNNSSKVVINFDVKNDSTVSAKLSSYTIGTPSCTAVNAEGGSVDVSNFCKQLKYTLVYKNGDSTTNVTNGLIIPAGGSKSMILTLSYDIDKPSNLPANDVKIDDLGVDMNFEQSTE